MRHRYSGIPAILLMVFLFVGEPLQAQTVLSLRQAVDLALSRAEEIELARLRVEQAGHTLDRLKAQRLPSVSLSASYSWISETAGIDLQVPGLFSRRLSFGDGNVYDAGITAAVPLFTGFRLSKQQDALQGQVLAATELHRARRIDVARTVASVYRRAQLARMSVRIHEQQREALIAQKHMLAALLAQGQALAYDTLVISSRIMALEVARTASENEHRNALLTLAVLVSPSESLEVDENTVVDDAFIHAGHAALLREALDQRPDIRQLAAQSASARSLADAERASLYPSVNAAASFHYGKPGVDQIRNEWMRYYTAGLSLQWNLWSWGADKHAIEAREIDARSMDLSERRLRTEVEAGITLLRNELDVLRANIALLEMQMVREEERFRLAGARLREGMANAVDVVDAETALTNASLERSKAVIQYAVKVHELSAAIGREQ
ncbi:MAG: TolC family protein [Bacteroidia bacterium]|nr:TolC family protein [Bacteroidia bacterium]